MTPDHDHARQFAEEWAELPGRHEGSIANLARCYLEALAAMGQALDVLEQDRTPDGARYILRDVIEKVGGR